MNNLKKALTREDPRKYYKNKIDFSGLKKTVHWNQLNFTPSSNQKPEKKGLQASLDEAFKKTIDSHFQNGELKQVPKLMKQLTSIYKQFRQDESRSSEAMAGVLQILRNMAKHQQGVLMKRQIQTSVEGLQRYIKEKKQRQKQKCLSEFNKLVEEMQPKDKTKDKTAALKLLHSTSAGNLKITVTREEYQFQEEPEIRKKKSLDFKSKSKASNSNKNIDSNKLQMFLRDSNIKLVKTKIQYDYSAILEASKSNIQPRNKTAVFEPKNEKEVTTKASNGKKNQGFVFYRPNKKH